MGGGGTLFFYAFIPQAKSPSTPDCALIRERCGRIRERSLERGGVGRYIRLALIPVITPGRLTTPLLMAETGPAYRMTKFYGVR